MAKNKDDNLIVNGSTVNVTDYLVELGLALDDAVFKATNSAVKETAHYLKNTFANSSPYDASSVGEHFKNSWQVAEYKLVAYVGNTKTVEVKSGSHKGNPPLLNILEYAEKSPYKGWVYNKLNQMKPELTNQFKNVFNKNINKEK